MIFPARHAMPFSGKTSLEKARQTHGIFAGAEVCGSSLPAMPWFGVARHVAVLHGRFWQTHCFLQGAEVCRDTVWPARAGTGNAGQTHGVSRGVEVCRHAAAMHAESGPGMVGLGVANTRRPFWASQFAELGPGAARRSLPWRCSHTASHGASQSAWQSSACRRLACRRRTGLGPARRGSETTTLVRRSQFSKLLNYE